MCTAVDTEVVVGRKPGDHDFQPFSDFRARASLTLERVR